MLVLCSSIFVVVNFVLYEIDKYGEQIVKVNYAHIITNADAKKVMDYHGILSMKWSVAHRDFIFQRNGKICKARAFEILKETK